MCIITFIEFKNICRRDNTLYLVATRRSLSKVKKNLHPDNYRPVVFQDLNNGATFLTRSTVVTEDTVTLDGNQYPLVKVHISSSSHPFFTGEERIVDIEGRVDKFKARAAAGVAAREKRAAAAQKLVKRAANKSEKAAKKQPQTNR